jgi:phage gp29-like protein
MQNPLTYIRAALARLTRRVVIVEDVGTQDQNERIGGNLRPEDVAAIMLEADDGYMYRLVDLADEFRQKDGHLQSILFSRECAVAQLPWQITPASEKRTDKRIAAWCVEWLNNFGADHYGPEPRDLPNLISHLQGAIYYGHATAELIYERIGGKQIPVGADPIHARRFCFEPKHGQLFFWDNNGALPFPGIDLLTKFPGQFIQYCPRINGGVATREGLMRVLIWAALFRNWGLRDWLRLAELAWKPWRFGKYNKGNEESKKNAGKEDKDALKTAIQRLTSTGACVLPDTVDLIVKYAEGGAFTKGLHLELMMFLAGEMSKTVLGSTLTVEQGRVGSQALGKEHAKRTNQWTEWDARNVSACIRRFLVAPAVRANFGRTALIPGFDLITEDAADFEATCRGFLMLSQAGLRIAAKDPRDRLGLSTPADGDEILFRPRPAGPMDDEPAAVSALPPAKPAAEPADEEIPVVVVDEEDDEA